MPNPARSVAPGSSSRTPMPLRSAFGGAVIGSTATARRGPSSPGQSVGEIELGEPEQRVGAELDGAAVRRDESVHELALRPRVLEGRVLGSLRHGATGTQIPAGPRDGESLARDVGLVECVRGVGIEVQRQAVGRGVADPQVRVRADRHRRGHVADVQHGDDHLDASVTEPILGIDDEPERIARRLVDARPQHDGSRDPRRSARSRHGPAARGSRARAPAR